MRRIAIILLILVLIVVSGAIYYITRGPEKRPDRPLAELVAARRAVDAARAEELRALTDRFLVRIEAKIAAARKSRGAAPPTIDLLVISGGGDWGAFGAGVLKGWGRAPTRRNEPEPRSGSTT